MDGKNWTIEDELVFQSDLIDSMLFNCDLRDSIKEDENEFRKLEEEGQVGEHPERFGVLDASEDPPEIESGHKGRHKGQDLSPQRPAGRETNHDVRQHTEQQVEESIGPEFHTANLRKKN